MSTLNSVDNSMAVEIASVLEFETDKAYKVYKDAVLHGSDASLNEAWKTYSKLDDTRRMFQRSMDSVKEVLDSV